MEHFKSRDITVRDSRLNDACYLATHLKESDVKEIWAASHSRPIESLSYGVQHSKPCLTICRKGVPVAMFGVVPIGKNGIIWMLGSDEIHKMKKTFVRISNIFISYFFEQYDLMFNYVHSQNKTSIGWLESCGATFDVPINFGVEGEIFQRFTFRKEEVHV